MEIRKKTIIGIGIMILLVLSMSTYAQEALPKITDDQAVFDRTQTSITALNSAKGKPDWNSPAANTLRQNVAADLAKYDPASIPEAWKDYDTTPRTSVTDQTGDDQTIDDQTVVQTNTGGSGKTNWGQLGLVIALALGMGGGGVALLAKKRGDRLKGKLADANQNAANLQTQLEREKAEIQKKAGEIHKVRSVIEEREKKNLEIAKLIDVPPEEVMNKTIEHSEEIRGGITTIAQTINPRIQHAVEFLIKEMKNIAKDLKVEAKVFESLQTDFKTLEDEAKGIDFHQIVQDIQTSDSAQKEKVNAVLNYMNYQYSALHKILETLKDEQPRLVTKKEELQKEVTRADQNGHSVRGLVAQFMVMMLSQNTNTLKYYYNAFEKNEGDFEKQQLGLADIREKIGQKADEFMSEETQLFDLHKLMQEKIKGGKLITIDVLQEIGAAIKKIPTDKLEQVENTLKDKLKDKVAMDSVFHTHHLIKKDEPVKLKIKWLIQTYHGGQIVLRMEKKPPLNSPQEAQHNEFKVNLYEIKEYMKEKFVDAMREVLKNHFAQEQYKLGKFREDAEADKTGEKSKLLGTEKQLSLEKAEKLFKICLDLGLITKEEKDYIRQLIYQVPTKDLKRISDKKLGIQGVPSKLQKNYMVARWIKIGYEGMIIEYVGDNQKDGYIVLLLKKRNEYKEHHETMVYLDNKITTSLKYLNDLINIKGGNKKSTAEIKGKFIAAFKAKGFKTIEKFLSL